MHPSTSPDIRSRLLQLWLIPLLTFGVATLIGTPKLPFTEGYTLPWELWLTLIVFTFLIWEAHLWGYRSLDRRLPFFVYPAQRVTFQVAGSWLITVLMFTGLILILFALYRQPFDLSVYLRFLAVALSIATLLNGIYVVYNLLRAFVQLDEVKTQELTRLLAASPKAPAVVPEKKQARAASLLIESGSRLLQLEYEEIAYIYAADGVVFVMKMNGQFLTTQYDSLAALADTVSEKCFFQFNRNFILHYQCVRSIAEDSNRKLRVEITPPMQRDNLQIIGVSRYRSVACKQWFKERLQSPTP